jgi:hypothetical protein
VLEELTRVTDRVPARTTRLDDVPEIERVDFLKMDVQGAELDVLRGATRLLGSALVVQTEVEFLPMYKDQPLFADVDAELRARGFAFHTFLSLSGRMFRPLLNAKTPHIGLRQTIWGEAVYARDFMRLGAMEPGQLLRMAVILHEMYQSFDLAALCLQHYDAKTKGGLWKVYMQRLIKEVPEPPSLDEAPQA